MHFPSELRLETHKLPLVHNQQPLEHHSPAVGDQPPSEKGMNWRQVRPKHDVVTGQMRNGGPSGQDACGAHTVRRGALAIRGCLQSREIIIHSGTSVNSAHDNQMLLVHVHGAFVFHERRLEAFAAAMIEVRDVSRALKEESERGVSCGRA